MSININKNEVIVRADSFLALYYYFKGSLPIDGIMDNLYQVEKINNATQIQINFNDSKFQLQTSFDGEENLHLDISSFVILYNSLFFGRWIVSLWKFIYNFKCNVYYFNI